MKDGTIKIPYKADILDLNGHVIRSNGSILQSENYAKPVIRISDSDLIIKDSNPTAVHKGFIMDDVFYLDDGKVAKPSGAEEVTIFGGIIMGGYGYAESGAIKIDGARTLTMNGGTIAGNISTCGGAFLLESGNKVIMNGGSISYNKSTGNAGAIHIQNGSLFVMNNGVIRGNYADAWGGAFHVRADENTTYEENGVKKEAVLVLKNGLIADNEAEYGGAIYHDTDEDAWVGMTSADVYSYSVSYIGNKAREDGGAIYSNGSSAAKEMGMHVMDGLFKGNEANRGAALYTNTSYFEVGGGVYTENITNSKKSGALHVANTDYFYFTGANRYVIQDNVGHNLIVRDDDDIYVTSSSAIPKNSIIYVYWDGDIENGTRLLESRIYTIDPYAFRSEIEGWYFVNNSDGRDVNFRKGTDPDMVITGDIDTSTDVKISKYTYKESQVLTGGFRYASVLDMSDLTARFYYTDQYFADDPTTNNEHLATMSLNLAMAAFQRGEDVAKSDIKDNIDRENGTWQYAMNPTSTYQAVKAKNGIFLLTNIGFTDVAYQYPVPNTTHTMGFIVGKKKIEVNGEDRYIVAVAMRGANYMSEWASNVTMQDDSLDHLAEGESSGFSSAAKIAYDNIMNYIANDPDLRSQEKVDYWVVGYSRGGAVANLVSRKLTENIKENGYDGRVFGRTFEAPQGGNNSDSTTYENIINYLNKNDLVPYVAPSITNFKRYGNNYYFEVDSTVNKMLSQLRTLDDRISFNNTYVEASVYLVQGIASQFRVNPFYTQMIAPTGSGTTRVNMPNYYSNLVKHLLNYGLMKNKVYQGTYPGDVYLSKYADLTYYVDSKGYFTPDKEDANLLDSDYKEITLQQALQNVIQIVFAMDETTSQKLSRVASSITDDINYISDGLAAYVHLLRQYDDLGYFSISFETFINNYKYLAPGIGSMMFLKKTRNEFTHWIMTLVDRYQNKEDIFEPDQYEQLIYSLPPVLDLLFEYASDDYQVNDMDEIGTLAYNATAIAQAHYPEINLAFLRAVDSFYNLDATPKPSKQIFYAPEAPTITTTKETVDGVYYGDVDITMNTTANNAMIFYTFDGSSPIDENGNISKSAYSYAPGSGQSINLPAEYGKTFTYTVKAVAYKEGVASTVTTATYTVYSALEVHYMYWHAVSRDDRGNSFKIQPRSPQHMMATAVERNTDFSTSHKFVRWYPADKNYNEVTDLSSEQYYVIPDARSENMNLMIEPTKANNLYIGSVYNSLVDRIDLQLPEGMKTTNAEWATVITEEANFGSKKTLYTSIGYDLDTLPEDLSEYDEIVNTLYSISIDWKINEPSQVANMVIEPDTDTVIFFTDSPAITVNGLENVDITAINEDEYLKITATFVNFEDNVVYDHTKVNLSYKRASVPTQAILKQAVQNRLEKYVIRFDFSDGSSVNGTSSVLETDLYEAINRFDELDVNAQEITIPIIYSYELNEKTYSFTRNELISITGIDGYEVAINVLEDHRNVKLIELHSIDDLASIKYLISDVEIPDITAQYIEENGTTLDSELNGYIPPIFAPKNGNKKYVYAYGYDNSTYIDTAKVASQVLVFGEFGDDYYLVYSTNRDLIVLPLDENYFVDTKGYRLKHYFIKLGSPYKVGIKDASKTFLYYHSVENPETGDISKVEKQSFNNMTPDDDENDIVVKSEKDVVKGTTLYYSQIENFDLNRIEISIETPKYNTALPKTASSIEFIDKSGKTYPDSMLCNLNEIILEWTPEGYGEEGLADANVQYKVTVKIPLKIDVKLTGESLYSWINGENIDLDVKKIDNTLVFSYIYDKTENKPSLDSRYNITFKTKGLENEKDLAYLSGKKVGELIELDVTSPDDKYYFDSDSFYLDESWKLRKVDDNTYRARVSDSLNSTDVTIEIPYKPYNLINEINITNVGPVVSGMPVHTIDDVLVDENAKYTIGSMIWSLDDHQVKYGRTNTVTFELIANDGYIFSDTVASIDGDYNVNVSTDGNRAIVSKKFKVERIAESAVVTPNVVRVPYGSSEEEILSLLPKTAYVTYIDGSSDNVAISEWKIGANENERIAVVDGVEANVSLSQYVESPNISVDGNKAIISSIKEGVNVAYSIGTDLNNMPEMIYVDESSCSVEIPTDSDTYYVKALSYVDDLVSDDIVKMIRSTGHIISNRIGISYVETLDQFKSAVMQKLNEQGVSDVVNVTHWIEEYVPPVDSDQEYIIEVTTVGDEGTVIPVTVTVSHQKILDIVVSDIPSGEYSVKEGDSLYINLSNVQEATIKYTIDDVEYEGSSIELPIGETVITAWAIKDGYINSAPVQFTYHVTKLHKITHGENISVTNIDNEEIQYASKDTVVYVKYITEQGKEFVSWIVDGIDITNQNEMFSFAMPDNSVQISANTVSVISEVMDEINAPVFDNEIYVGNKLDSTTKNGNSISWSPDDQIADGGTVYTATFEVKAGEGNIFAKDVSAVVTNSVNSIVSLNEDRTIATVTSVFEKTEGNPESTQYNVEYSTNIDETSYTIKKAVRGENVEISAENKEDYEFVNWEVNGVTVSELDNEVLSFRMPANSVSVKANYEKAKVREEIETIEIEPIELLVGYSPSGALKISNADVKILNSSWSTDEKLSYNEKVVLTSTIAVVDSDEKCFSENLNVDIPGATVEVSFLNRVRTKALIKLTFTAKQLVLNHIEWNVEDIVKNAIPYENAKITLETMLPEYVSAVAEGGMDINVPVDWKINDDLSFSGKIDKDKVSMIVNDESLLSYSASVKILPEIPFIDFNDGKFSITSENSNDISYTISKNGEKLTEDQKYNNPVSLIQEEQDVVYTILAISTNENGSVSYKRDILIEGSLPKHDAHVIDYDMIGKYFEKEDDEISVRTYPNITMKSEYSIQSSTLINKTFIGWIKVNEDIASYSATDLMSYMEEHYSSSEVIMDSIISKDEKYTDTMGDSSVTYIAIYSPMITKIDITYDASYGNALPNTAEMKIEMGDHYRVSPDNIEIIWDPQSDIMYTDSDYTATVKLKPNEDGVIKLENVNTGYVEEIKTSLLFAPSFKATINEEEPVVKLDGINSTFKLLYRTTRYTLTIVDDGDDVLVDNGLDVNEILAQMPSQISVILTDEEGNELQDVADIVWFSLNNLDGSAYDPNNPEKQTLNALGTISVAGRKIVGSDMKISKEVVVNEATSEIEATIKHNEETVTDSITVVDGDVISIIPTLEGVSIGVKIDGKTTKLDDNNSLKLFEEVLNHEGTIEFTLTLRSHKPTYYIVNYVLKDMPTDRYKFTSGGGQIVELGSEKELYFVTNGDFGIFEGIEIDGIKLNENEYRAESGSTHIWLDAKYVSSLNVGEHEIRAYYTGHDEKVSTTFSVLSKRTPSPTPSSNPEVQNNVNTHQYRSCQDAGYSEEYEWDDNANACVLKIADSDNNNKVRVQVIPNSADNFNIVNWILLFLNSLFLTIFAAIFLVRNK